MSAARTFGDLLRLVPLTTDKRCTACRVMPGSRFFPGVRRYACGRYICDRCIHRRRRILLPHVVRLERLRARMVAFTRGAALASVGVVYFACYFYVGGGI